MFLKKEGQNGHEMTLIPLQDTWFPCLQTPNFHFWPEAEGPLDPQTWGTAPMAPLLLLKITILL